MAVFVVRRLVVSFFVLLASSFLVFTLVSISGDPLEELRLDTSPNRDTRIAARTELLGLDDPVPVRYARWIGGAAGCVIPGQPCDLGRNLNGQDVTALVGTALSSTVRLLTTAVLLAIVLGVTVGIVSALRQYSGFDYSITLLAFLLFSLPVFWVAVLLKQYAAIAVNDWWADPDVSLGGYLAAAVVTGLTAGAVVGGSPQRRWAARATVAAGAVLLLAAMDAVNWFTRPALGPAVIALGSFGAAIGATALVAGLRRRNVLEATLATAAVGSVVQFAVTPWLSSPTWASWTNIGLLLVVAVLVAVGIGRFRGGLDPREAITATVITAVCSGALMVVDLLLRNVNSYAALVDGRIFSTTGSETPGFDGTFWQQQLDIATHLVLPTLAVMLISFAGYSRFSRASMLEVLNADYVRTARSKGLTERAVVLRHAFRNALIPVTTLVAFDIGGLVGGAVITETVFARTGMGTLFVTGLDRTDPNPVMGFYLVTALSIVLLNLMADIAYAYLDPRIRLS